MTDTSADIRWARSCYKALRRNQNNTAATSRPAYREYTIAHYAKELDRVMSRLVADDPRTAGLLTEEFELTDRIAASRKAGFARPELTKRVRAIRQEVK